MIPYVLVINNILQEAFIGFKELFQAKNKLKKFDNKALRDTNVESRSNLYDFIFHRHR